MSISILMVISTVLALYIAQRLAQFAYQYMRTLIVTRKVPGLPGTKFIQGDLWFSDYNDFFQNNIKYVGKTGVKLYAAWLYFFYPYYSLTHPDTAKVVFTSSVPKREFTGNGYLMLKPWTGNGLLAHRGGPEWERKRKLLAPAFHFEVLKGYLRPFNDVAGDLLVKLSKEASKNGISIDVCPPISCATLDVMLRCIFSYEGKVQELGEDHPYAKAVHRLSNLFITRLLSPLLYPDFIYKRTEAGKEFYSLCDYVHKFAMDIIAKRRIALSSQESDTKRQSDLVDILLKARDENGQGLSDEEIRAEVDTFLPSGHDTTSVAISWGVYALAKYPHEQQKIYQEVNDVVGQGEVEWGHLSRLKYLQSFIKETMRMFSIVPLLGRTLDKPMTFDGVTLPENSVVEINIAAMNHRPDVWSDHEEFRPGRFAKADVNRDPLCFVPFSAGPRNCIGQNFALNELKVILARLVQTFQTELDSSHLVEQFPELVMRPKNGIKVFFHPR